MKFFVIFLLFLSIPAQASYDRDIYMIKHLEYQTCLQEHQYKLVKWMAQFSALCTGRGGVPCSNFSRARDFSAEEARNLRNLLANGSKQAHNCVKPEKKQ